MSNGSGRFMFAGHAIGAAARFHRLDDLENLNHVTPTLGASVLPVTGGRCESHLEQPYRMDVDLPRRRCLMQVEEIRTVVEGRDAGGLHETELSIDVMGLHVVEKLHIDHVRLHMLATRGNAGRPAVTTQGNRIEGLRLGDVEVQLTLDDEPLANTGDEEQLTGYYAAHGQQLEHAGEYSRCSLVREIRLIGSEQAQLGMSVDGYTIVWKGFGRIILGEIHVKGHERRLTMVRLAMGSDAGGSGAAADGQTNGTTGTG